ncbi:MAG: secondary thiamine-phosphate synthase enzyme YjbQ [Candidatus Paceibacterota bacterium]|jgi:secondary thiamine-phosphate synthase enzyme
MTKNKTIEFETQGDLDFVDLTGEVSEFVKSSGVKEGLINIQSMHTSAALIVNENEPLLIEDIKDNLRRTAPKEASYNHDNMKIRTVNVCDNECINGHSHCQAIHLLVSATLNIIQGEIQLGRWQRIFFVELDQKRPRKVQLQIIGE